MSVRAARDDNTVPTGFCPMPVIVTALPYPMIPVNTVDNAKYYFNIIYNNKYDYYILLYILYFFYAHIFHIRIFSV